MKKAILLVILGANALMQAGGASIMTFAPAKAAREVFHVAASPEALQLLGVIGGATYGCLLLGAVAMFGIARGRRAGYDLAVLFGVMLACIGVVMLATGTGAGLIDLAKGVVIAGFAWWASSDARVAATA